MPESRLDADGRVRVPEEALAALGWEAGAELQLQVEGDQLLVQPATRTGTLKDEARRLASAMRDLTRGAARQMADSVQSAVGSGQPPPGSVRPAAQPAQPAGGSRPDPLGAVTQPFQGAGPLIPSSVYLAPGSVVIGDVALGEDCSVWSAAVLRGDVANVRVGARSNIQEGAVVHVSPQVPCIIGAGVTIGHQATVHACTVADNVLIGIHAVLLDGVRVGEHCIIAAGAVVPPGMAVPSGKMVMGVPAQAVRDLTAEEIQRIHWNADSYVSLKNQYRAPATPTPPAAPVAPPKPSPPARGALPRYEVRRTAGAISIDGSLDDAGWAGIPALSALVHAHGGGQPKQPTEVKACWDEACLYLSFACKDADVWGNFTERDDPLYEEEAVEAFLCPTGDLRHYYELEISPLNVLFDAKVFNPEGDRRSMLVDREWNAAGIRTAVRVSGSLNERSSPDLGWITEVALPFADLGLLGPPTAGMVWRANFFRIERGEETEFTAWSPTYGEPPDFHVPACFGELVFVDDAEGL